jgi:hypothetical protein
MDEILRRVDPDRLPTTDQPYDIPPSFACASAAANGTPVGDGSANNGPAGGNSGTGRVGAGSTMHDRALYSMWVHFVEFCQQLQHDEQNQPVGAPDTVANDHGNSSGSQQIAGQEPALNRHLGTPRLPVFVYLAHHAGRDQARAQQLQVQAQARDRQQQQIARQRQTWQVTCHAGAASPTGVDCAVFSPGGDLALVREADCANMTGAAWLEDERGGSGSPNSPVAAVDQMLLSLGLGDAANTGAESGASDGAAVSPVLQLQQRKSYSSCFKTPPRGSIGSGSSSNDRQTRPDLAWYSGVHVPPSARARWGTS